MRTFVDTNVWVYALDGRDRAKQEAAIESIRADPSTIVVSPQVMGELYVTLVRFGERSLSAVDAAVAVDALRRFTVVPLEVGHVMAALDLVRLHSLSYWDALIVAAARAGGCERILTEDLADGSVIAGVRVESPFVDRGRRLSETSSSYGFHGDAAWDDAALRTALGEYEGACLAAGMRPNAVHSYWDYARRFLDWREGAYPRGAAAVRPVPARVVDVDELRTQVLAYRRAVEEAGLGRASVETYRRHALFFVRWLAGEFRPGARLRGRAAGR